MINKLTKRGSLKMNCPECEFQKEDYYGSPVVDFLMRMAVILAYVIMFIVLILM